MSLYFIAAAILVFIALLWVAQRWSIIAAGALLLILAALVGCVSAFPL